MAAVITALAIGISAAEATSRVDDWIFSDVHPLASPNREHDLTIRETWGVRGRPNGHYRRWTLNRHGFLGPENSIEPAGHRIMLLGASETFGLYESKGQDYPTQLSRELKRRGKADVEVLNAAVAGMTLPAMTVYWEKWAKTFKPDTVLIYPSSHFYLSDEVPKPPELLTSIPLPTVPSLSSRFAERLIDQLKQSSLLRSIRAQWLVSRALENKGPDYIFKGVPTDRLNAFTADLEGLALAIERAGARPVLVTHALKQKGELNSADRAELGYFRIFFPRATADLFPAFSTEARRKTLDLAERRGWLVVDAAAALTGRRELFADPVHFNDAGSRSMAGILAQALSPALASRTGEQVKLGVR